jgi:ERCC4-type nuclease
MRICIDVREAALIALLPDATVKPLTLGDITIEEDDGTELVILERKTVADLAASIKDGRYREQATRLTDFSLSNHNIVYLVEGTLRGAKLPMPCETLMGAMVSLWYGKGFSVMRTESLEQTAQFLRVMLAKFIKEGGYAQPKVEAHDAKRAKMDSITPDNIDALMLSQIPYVNMLTAEAVLHEHRTIARLTGALHENPDCLNKTMSLGEKPRKISSKSIESIKTFLLKPKE